MTRKAQAYGGDLYRLNSEAKAFMAQPSKQVPTKEMIQSVRECVPGRSNNEIHMVLEYYDHNVDAAIQAFVENGAAEALGDWHHTGNPKSSNKKSKKAKSKAQQADAAAAAALVTAAAAVEAVVAAADHQSTANGFDVDTPVTTQLSATDDVSASNDVRLHAAVPSHAADVTAAQQQQPPPVKLAPTAFAPAVVAAAVPHTDRRSSAPVPVGAVHVAGQCNGTDVRSVPLVGASGPAGTAAAGSLTAATGHSVVADAPSRPIPSLPNRGRSGSTAAAAAVKPSVEGVAAVAPRSGPADAVQEQVVPAAAGPGTAATGSHQLNGLGPGPTSAQHTNSTQAAAAAAGGHATAAVAGGSRQPNGVGLTPAQHTVPSQAAATTAGHAAAHASGHSRGSGPTAAHATGHAAVHATGHATGHAQHSQLASLSKPRAGLEKSSKDLQRQTVSLTHLQLVFNEECEKSLKKIKAVFEDLRVGLNEREADLMYQLDKAKDAGGEIFTHRLKKAAELRMQCERCPAPPSGSAATAAAHSAEQQLADLRADIKHFVSERKIDEELSHAAHFIVSDTSAADLLEAIRCFGEVVPVKSGYTSARRPSSSSACSGTDGDDSATKAQRRRPQQQSQPVPAKGHSSVSPAAAAAAAEQTAAKSGSLAGTPPLTQNVGPAHAAAAPSRHSAAAAPTAAAGHVGAAPGEDGRSHAGQSASGTACAHPPPSPALLPVSTAIAAAAAEGQTQACQQQPAAAAAASASPSAVAPSAQAQQIASGRTEGRGSVDPGDAVAAKPAAQAKQQPADGVQQQQQRRRPQQQFYERPPRQHADWSEEVEDADERQDWHGADQNGYHDGYGRRVYRGQRGGGGGRGQGHFGGRWADGTQRRYHDDQRHRYYDDDGRRSGASTGGSRVYRRSPGSGGGQSTERQREEEQQQTQRAAAVTVAAAGSMPSKPIEPSSSAAAGASIPAAASGSSLPDAPTEPSMQSRPAPALQSNGYRAERGRVFTGRGGGGGGRGRGSGHTRGAPAHHTSSQRSERAGYARSNDDGGAAQPEPNRSRPPSAAAGSGGEVAAAADAGARGAAAAASAAAVQAHGGIGGSVGTEHVSGHTPSNSAVNGAGARDGGSSGSGGGAFEKALPQRQPRSSPRGRGRAMPKGDGHPGSSDTAAHRPDGAAASAVAATVAESIDSCAHEVKPGGLQ